MPLRFALFALVFSLAVSGHAQSLSLHAGLGTWKPFLAEDDPYDVDVPLQLHARLGGGLDIPLTKGLAFSAALGLEMYQHRYGHASLRHPFSVDSDMATFLIRAASGLKLDLGPRLFLRVGCMAQLSAFALGEYKVLWFDDQTGYFTREHYVGKLPGNPKFNLGPDVGIGTRFPLAGGGSICPSLNAYVGLLKTFSGTETSYNPYPLLFSAELAYCFRK